MNRLLLAVIALLGPFRRRITPPPSGRLGRPDSRASGREGQGHLASVPLGA